MQRRAARDENTHGKRAPVSCRPRELYTIACGHHGPSHVWLGVLIDYAVRAVILMLRFHGGRWTRLRY